MHNAPFALSYHDGEIGDLRVALNLIVKARLSAKHLLWKLVFSHMQT